MVYESTRDKNKRLKSTDVILQGISDDGGLFVPSYIPKMDSDFILSMMNLDYRERQRNFCLFFN